MPSSWQAVSFDGVSFSVPASWPVARTSVANTLGPLCSLYGTELSDVNPEVSLSTDRSSTWDMQCPFSFPVARPPGSGVDVDKGANSAEAAFRASFSKACLRLHGLTACPATTWPYSVLVLRVTVPGSAQPVYVAIGLVGNGAVARTILYSLRPALTSTNETHLPAVDPPSFVLATLPAATLGRETVVALYSPLTGRVVRVLHTFGPSFTNNGLAISPNGADVYVTLNQGPSLSLERISVATRQMTFVAYGEQPALSPNGRFLAYIVGTSEHELAVRDLVTGQTRVTDLAALLGRSEDLLNGTITWLGGGSEIVVLPGEQLVAYGPGATTTTEPPLKGSCEMVDASQTCLIVVHVAPNGVLGARQASGLGLCPRRQPRYRW